MVRNSPVSGKTGQDHVLRIRKLNLCFQCLYCCRRGAAVEHMALLSAPILGVITYTTFFVELICR